MTFVPHFRIGRVSRGTSQPRSNPKRSVFVVSWLGGNKGKGVRIYQNEYGSFDAYSNPGKLALLFYRWENWGFREVKYIQPEDAQKELRSCASFFPICPLLLAPSLFPLSLSPILPPPAPRLITTLKDLDTLFSNYKRCLLVFPQFPLLGEKQLQACGN